MFHTIRWTLDKIKQRLELIAPQVYIRQSPLPAFRYRPLDGPLETPPLDADLDDSAWTKIGPTDYWGAWMTDFILRTHFTVPADWELSQPAALYLPLGESGDFSHPEALAYVDGIPYAACDRHHQEILLNPEWADGQPHLLALHGWTGLGGMEKGDYFTKLYMRQCSVVQIHPPTRDFIALARVAHQTAAALAEETPARHHLLNALNEAFCILETRVPGDQAFYASVEPALTALRAGIEKAGAPLDVILHASGHAHIDVAWLWTLGETRRKAERTFHNVIRYMEQFPRYHFSQSQPQLYEWMRQDQPALFEAIRQRVQQGRWEPMGGMWVEADCNLSGAESLARQFLLGRTFFRQHFGKDAETPVLWLPDVFGYAWALPQLIRQAGLKYFMTIKIGWSQYNRLPYDTFLWQGLDGSRVLTHFSTVKEFGSPFASTYNAMANPAEALGAWANFQQKELHSDLLMAYGFGDGGGGPTREMLENIEQMGDFPALPQVQQSSVKAFFEAIEAQEHDSKMPIWNGELYLEYHRGTYTTQARNKRANRKSEFLLHDAEFLAVCAALLDPSYAYPAERFTEAWRTICLNQFHDIIPGSSIGPVYAESQAQYAQLTTEMTATRQEALAAIARKMPGDLLLANPTAFPRTDLAFVAASLTGVLPDEVATTRNDQPLATQPVEGGFLLDAGELPPLSLTPIRLSNSAPQAARRKKLNSLPTTPDHVTLENEYLRVEFDAAGDITRIYDKSAQREALAPESIGNQFQAFEDRPKSFDAWDIDIYYDDKMWLAEPAASICLVENGPLRQAVEIKRRILNSTYTQRISLAYNSPRLDFDTTIQWNERSTLLKVAFPVDILSPQATYEIQWGNVQRPTHRNTSWDWGRFESCAHKWVDLSEGGYGVSLLNDCKYGHDIHANVMRITLLRGPSIPDPMADYGEHRFAYSLLPHSGSWEERTQAAAYALNDPIIAYLHTIPYNEEQPHLGRSGLLRDEAGDTISLFSVSAPNVIIETVKRAEDGEGIIVRLYESQRKRGSVTLQCAFPLKQAWETNLLEENQSALSVDKCSLHLELKPFQIITLRLVK